jgi:hypothetical protein
MRCLPYYEVSLRREPQSERGFRAAQFHKACRSFYLYEYN